MMLQKMLYTHFFPGICRVSCILMLLLGYSAYASAETYSETEEQVTTTQDRQNTDSQDKHWRNNSTSEKQDSWVIKTNLSYKELIRKIEQLEQVIKRQSTLLEGLQKDIRMLNMLTTSISISEDGTNLYFTGVNVHIRNGTGSTNSDAGLGATVNELGNLIVGYNELRDSGNIRSGSHNIILGSKNNYSSYGGLVAGYRNSIIKPYATITGGTNNTADGTYSSISGGLGNKATGDSSSIIGGVRNRAIGLYSSISGGLANKAKGQAAVVGGGGYNSAEGEYSSISSGWRNTTIGTYSSISGGGANIASGENTSISGGRENITPGYYSSISGGGGNTTSGDYSTVTGGRNNTAWGNIATVSGGQGNTANAHYSSVSGGYNRRVADPSGWAAGSLYEDN